MRINRSLLNWGVFLIALGGVPLAVQQGWADADIAADLWRVWPLILVGIGLGLILRWTPLAWLGGALVAGTFGLIFGAIVAGGIQGVSIGCAGLGSGESQTTSEDGPTSAASFSLELELSCGDLEVARAAGDTWSVVAEHGPDDSPAIAGTESGLTIDQGIGPDDFFAFTQQTRNDWTVGLPVEAALTVAMTLNAAAGTVDLGAGPVSAVDGTFNASDITLDLGAATTPTPASLGLTFNASSGRLTLPDAAVSGAMTLNASSLTICLPASAEARFELDSTLSSDDLGSSRLSEVDGGWETEGYGTASTRVDLAISSTVSSIDLERSEVCQ
jgi:hypothetical protein